MPMANNARAALNRIRAAEAVRDELQEGPVVMIPRTGLRTAARGQLVKDEATGRVGTLMYVGSWSDPSVDPGTRTTCRLAFIRPEHGGREWTTTPDKVTVLHPVAGTQKSEAHHP